MKIISIQFIHPLVKTAKKRKIFKMVEAMGIKTYKADGNDVINVMKHF